MRIRTKPNPNDDKDIARTSAAYSKYMDADRSSKMNSDDEQQEDQLIETIDQGISSAKDAVAQLKALQQGQQNKPNDKEMAAIDSGKPMDSDTGSPSAQGWP